MVHYKLIYFNGRGRAEIMRLVFAVADVKYEDIRIADEEWPALKPSTPFGQIPILEIDGKTFCQSRAISRYLARNFNLAGKTDLEELQVDMVIDCMEDILKPFFVMRRESDETRKAELKKKYSEVQLPTGCAGLESILKSNNGGDGFLVGDELTWADLSFHVFARAVKMGGDEAVLDKYPKLKALRERVNSVPRVAAWIAERPVTDY